MKVRAGKDLEWKCEWERIWNESGNIRGFRMKLPWKHSAMVKVMI